MCEPEHLHFVVVILSHLMGLLMSEQISVPFFYSYTVYKTRQLTKIFAKKQFIC